jgi:hypothetical protein
MLTSFTSILTASASKAFSINSFTTLETEVMVCVLVTSFTVDHGSCLIDIFHTSRRERTVFIFIITRFHPKTSSYYPSFPHLTRRATCAVCMHRQCFTSKTPMCLAKDDNSRPRNRGILAFQSACWCSA